MGVNDINGVTLISILTWTWLVVQIMENNDINKVTLISVFT